jgi:hypothetical protein
MFTNPIGCMFKVKAKDLPPGVGKEGGSYNLTYLSDFNQPDGRGLLALPF